MSTVVHPAQPSPQGVLRKLLILIAVCVNVLALLVTCVAGFFGALADTSPREHALCVIAASALGLVEIVNVAALFRLGIRNARFTLATVVILNSLLVSGWSGYVYYNFVRYGALELIVFFFFLAMGTISIAAAVVGNRAAREGARLPSA